MVQDNGQVTPADPERPTYDQRFQALQGLPRELAIGVGPSTVQTVTPIRQLPEAWIVQTIRHRERGDTIFLTCSGPTSHVRIALPPEVADRIAAQRAALKKKVRSAIGRHQAEERKNRGEVPGFMKPGAKKPRKGRKAAKTNPAAGHGGTT